MRTAWTDGRLSPALIGAFAALCALAGVFTLPPLDRDEARFAEATAEMLESGDFVTITFQGEERNKKPAGIHWLQAASVSAFSSPQARAIWAYRLPSTLGAVLAALFTYAAGRRLFDARTATIAALLLASAPIVAGEATIAKTDAMLLACAAAALAALVHIIAGVVDGERGRWRWPIVFWTAIGAGVLLKGPIILMVVFLAGAAFAIGRRRLDFLAATRPVSGLLILILMISPWAVAVHEATDGRFFAEAIGADMLAKIGGAQEHHGGPPGYHAFLLFLLFWPAAALIPPGAAGAVATRSDWRSLFLLSWIVPSFVVFELTATKLPHYPLPLYPAIALIAARAIGSPAHPVARKAGAILYGLAGMAVAAVVAAAPIAYRTAPSAPFGVLAAVAIAAATALIAFSYWRGQSATATPRAILLSAGAAFLLLAGVLPGLDRLAISPRLNAAIDAAGLHPLRDGAPPVVLSGYYEPSAVFLLGTATQMAEGAAAADRLAAFRGAAVIESRESAAFLSRLAAIGGAVDAFAEIDGVNYSNGEEVALRLYRWAPTARFGQDFP